MNESHPNPFDAGVSAILAERQKTHGDYKEHAEYSQQIKAIIANSDNLGRMMHCQREALDMIAHKIARILAGNPHERDHWVDIAGYATLTASQLPPRQPSVPGLIITRDASSEPSKNGQEPDLATSIAEVIKEESLGGAACGWQPCSGCHETNEGASTGWYPHSQIFRCEIGHGCHECGGIGVIWQHWPKGALEEIAAIPRVAVEQGDQS